MTKTATPSPTKLNGYRGDAKLYRLSELLEGYEWVIVSAADVPFSGPETYIFGATPKGDVAAWSELPGSYKGGQSHETALLGAGYEVTA